MNADGSPSVHAPRPLHAVWLGQRPYAECYALQLALHEYVKQAAFDVVLLLEHEACITRGRGAKAEHLLASAEVLQAQNISLHTTDRGGDITLHAPGQLVAYPIVNLNWGRKDVRRYVNNLTASMAALLAPYGVDGGTLTGKVGLWVDRACKAHWPAEPYVQDPAKIAAIGVRISRWVTLHGFALNLRTDLSLFQWIVPCGIADLPVTSLQALQGDAPSPEALSPAAQRCLAERLELTLGRFDVHTGPLELAALEHYWR